MTVGKVWYNKAIAWVIGAVEGGNGMAAVRSVKNQYLGINAHLHSYWQAEGGWSDFHTRHIVHLVDTLKPLLLPLGYTAAIEPSIQIRRLDGPAAPENPEADVLIYERDPGRFRPARPQPVLAGTGEVVLPLVETLALDQRSEREYSAVKLYALQAGRPQRGEPVAWIELLSASNKPGGRDAQEYLDKRIKIVENGIVFIELDYLHESASTIRGFPSYRRRRNQASAAGAHPYRLVIIDPRPDLAHGQIRVREFDVDEALPTVKIPLVADDALAFDFGLPYRKTFEEALFGLELVDYRQLPVNFQRYSDADQTRIAARMVTVLEAAQQGHNLEKAPFPAKIVMREEALTEIQRINAAD